MDFNEYYETGEENPKQEEIVKETQILDEGLVDVVFQNIRTAMKTSVAGSLIYFRWEWMNTKTFFTMRIKRKTLVAFSEWLNNILDESKST